MAKHNPKIHRFEDGKFVSYEDYKKLVDHFDYVVARHKRAYRALQQKLSERDNIIKQRDPMWQLQRSQNNS